MQMTICRTWKALGDTFATFHWCFDMVQKYFSKLRCSQNTTDGQFWWIHFKSKTKSVLLNLNKMATILLYDLVMYVFSRVWVHFKVRRKN